MSLIASILNYLRSRFTAPQATAVSFSGGLLVPTLQLRATLTAPKDARVTVRELHWTIGGGPDTSVRITDGSLTHDFFSPAPADVVAFVIDETADGLRSAAGPVATAHFDVPPPPPPDLPVPDAPVLEMVGVVPDVILGRQTHAKKAA